MQDRHRNQVVRHHTATCAKARASWMRYLEVVRQHDPYAVDYSVVCQAAWMVYKNELERDCECMAMPDNEPLTGDASD